MGWFRKSVEQMQEAARSVGFLAPREEIPDVARPGARMLAKAMQDALEAAPINGQTFDSIDCENGIKGAFVARGAVSDALLGWYMSQGFIGYQVAAFLSTHWLIDKACMMPARDAVRQGYKVVADSGDQLPDDVLKMVAKADERYKLKHHLTNFVGRGRTFGIRIALFKVSSTDPNYYEHPFNPDGITPGSYKGIVQVDPYWVTPDLDALSATDPASLHYYEPTYWLINGRRYHRSHLVIYRTCEVPDILKPMYRYGGVPVPQRIMERVYCAERTANEAPELAMTKRLTAFGTDAAAALANPDGLSQAMAEFVRYRNNYGVKVHDKDSESIQQFDTSLADLDAVIMSQYQLVAAAANVPATKLLGTTPKGFNATGEYEESSYHEELESVQMDMTPLIERHHMLVMRSDIAPKIDQSIPLSVVWNPLDSPTKKEEAETRKIEAERDQVLIDSGVIAAEEVRNRLSSDPESGYFGIPKAEMIEEEPTGAGAETPTQ